MADRPDMNQRSIPMGSVVLDGPRSIALLIGLTVVHTTNLYNQLSGRYP